MSKTKIIRFEAENVKRVRLVEVDISETGLIVFGGRNGQGKTSALNGIMWTLGGDRYRPSQPIRDGETKLRTKVVLSNGIVAERKGVNGALTVTDETGGKAGQALLNEFVSSFALDLPKFMASTALEKSKLLLESLPGDVAEKVAALDRQIKGLYNERLIVGRDADRKQKHADDLPYNEDVPGQLLSGGEMAARLQAAMAVNAKNQAARDNVDKIRDSVKSHELRVQSAAKRVAELETALAEARKEQVSRTAQLATVRDELLMAESAVTSLVDEDVKSVREEMVKIDSINAKIRTNMTKVSAEAEAQELHAQYNGITANIEALRAERLKLLAEIVMPLEGLAIDEEGLLSYNGKSWDCMSGSEQMRASTAICAALKPDCGFVLLDRLEALDKETLAEFGAWLAANDLQGIATRVGSEGASIVIEDGMVAEQETKAEDIEFT